MIKKLIFENVFNSVRIPSMKNNIPENKQRKYRDQCTRSHTNSEVVFNENQNNAIQNYKLNIVIILVA